MKTFEVEWSTTDSHTSDDDVVNGIREAIARYSSNSKVGWCVISLRNQMSGLAHVNIDGPVAQRYMWKELDIEVRKELPFSNLD